MTSSVLALALLLFHPESLSSTRITIDGMRADVVMRCRLASLLAAVEDVDDEAAVFAYVRTRFSLHADTNRERGGGVALNLVDTSMAVAAFGDEMIGGDEAVDLTLSFESDAPIEDLVVRSNLFHDVIPDHVDLLSIDWGDGGLATYALDTHRPEVRSDPTGRGAFAAFMRLGVRHILSGWDHLAFVAVLILASRRVRSLLAVITAFTVAHSITLVLAALDVIDVSALMRTIEVAIALSIVYVAIDTLLAPRLTRPRWPEALVFGLLHGLGFASFLTHSLVHEPGRVAPLAGFNVGVECGQVAVAVGVVAVMRVLPRGKEDADFIAPAWLRVGGGVLVALVGVAWVVERLASSVS